MKSSHAISRIRCLKLKNIKQMVCLQCYCSMFHGLGPLTCSESKLTSEYINPFTRFGRASMGDRPIARTLRTQAAQHEKTQTYIYV
jgi:hypothetical protein